MADLTPRQRLFVDEYLKDLNATQAAIRSGLSAATANVTGAQLLAQPSIQDAIAYAFEQRRQRVQIDADYVLRSLKEIADFDPALLHVDKGAVFSNIHDIPKPVRQCLASYEVEEHYEVGEDVAGDPVQIKVVIRKIKLYSRAQVLEMLGRHLALFRDRIEVTGAEGGAIQVNDMNTAARVLAILNAAQQRAAGLNPGPVLAVDNDKQAIA